MGKIETDHTGSGGGITLSSDGTSLLLDGTAIGGAALELYAENPSSPVAPSATGANGVALGREATSPGADSVAIGWNAYAQAQTSSPGHAMGRNANVTSGGVAIGNFADATGVYATALGTSADATALNASALGNDAEAAGTSSVAIGKSYASGTDSFAAAIANNTSSYGATGANSIAIGQNAKATSSKGVAIGYGTQATANYGMAIGHECQAPHQESVALGTRSQTRSKAHFAFGTGALVSAGFAQAGMIVIHGRTGDATQGTLVSDSGLQSLGTAGNSNQLIVPSYGAIAFDGILVARGQGSIANTDSAAWKIEGLIRKESSNATTTLVNSAITVISNGPSWGIELSADTTNGALSVKVTGAASTNVKWVCTLRSSETLYNTY